MILIAGQAIVAFLLWKATGDASPWTRAATVAAPFLLLIPLFIWNMYKVPQIIDRESSEEISRLQLMNDSKSNMKRNREQLAGFLSIGEALDASCRQDSKVQDQPYIDWANSITRFLNAEMDSSYSTLFLSDAGLLPLSPTGDLNENQRRIATWMIHRRQRLAQLLSELRG